MEYGVDCVISYEYAYSYGALEHVIPPPVCVCTCTHAMPVSDEVVPESRLRVSVQIKSE